MTLYYRKSGTSVSVATFGTLVHAQKASSVPYVFCVRDSGSTSYVPLTTEPSNGFSFKVRIGGETCYLLDYANLSVGDTGPAGGIIFYDRGFFFNWRYLEACPYQTSLPYGGQISDNNSGGDAVWGGKNTHVGTSEDIGQGQDNTQAIVTAFGSSEPYAGRSDYAARQCADLDYGGFTDWFLPSRQEQATMCANKSYLDGYSLYAYWTSSEEDFDDNAYVYLMETCSDGPLSRALERNVRPIRRF